MKVLIGRETEARKPNITQASEEKQGWGKEADSPLGTSFSNAAIPAAWASCFPRSACDLYRHHLFGALGYC